MFRWTRLTLALALIAPWIGIILNSPILCAEWGKTPADQTPNLSSRPNILLIIGDNWSYRHASANGERAIRTPTFDRICQEGTRFTNAFCPVPSCSPTRASMLTGRIAHQLEDAANLWSKFTDRWPTFMDALDRHGYQVGYCGKGWGPGRHEGFGRARNPAGESFESFELFLEQRVTEGVSASPNDHAAKPFCFWLGDTSTAFGKWQPGEGNQKGIDPRHVTVPSYLPDTQPVRDEITDYLAAVLRLDKVAADAIQLLTSRNLLDKTIILYTSDNGWQMPHGLANCYDAGTHVPLAIRLPSALPSNHTPKQIDDFVSLTDLAPTILEWAGLEPSQYLPGITSHSIAGLLRGEGGDIPRDCVMLERERHANVRRNDAGYPIRGIRTADHLYLCNLRPDRWPAGDPELVFAVGPFGDVDPSRSKQWILDRRDTPAFRKFFQLNFDKRPREELYDLRQDPDQIQNVVADPAYASIKRELQERLRQWMSSTDDPRLEELMRGPTPTGDRFDTYPYFGPPYKPKLSPNIKPAN